jgi:hypothetical protein
MSDNYDAQCARLSEAFAKAFAELEGTKDFHAVMRKVKLAVMGKDFKTTEDFLDAISSVDKKALRLTSEVFERAVLCLLEDEEDPTNA